MLKQRFDDTGLENYVGCFSRLLTSSERNYVAYKLKMYAVLRAVKNFRMFALGKEFLLRTDYVALRNLLFKDLPPTTRVAQLILRLSEYPFRILYQRGQDNVIADVLSRFPFATENKCGTSPVSNIPLNPSKSTSATTCFVPEIPNLSLVNFETRGNFESDSDIGDSDSD